MPEGHTIHRLAADLARDLVGATPVGASSPQGRFAAGAARLDGRRLTETIAHGKHLWCHFDNGDILHVHLGLIGKFRRLGVTVAPRPTARLRLENGATAWQLTGPQTCALVTIDEVEDLRARLGPDPLIPRTRSASFVSGLQSTKRAIGVALLDQSVVAGIGNVYRAELCFLTGVHPFTPASAIDEATALRLWIETKRQLRRGFEWNRIVTVSTRDLGRRVHRRLRADDRLYCYHRTGLPCRRCLTPIAVADLGGRSIWWCPSCQPLSEELAA